MIGDNLKGQAKDIALTMVFSLMYIFLVVQFSVVLLLFLPVPFIILGIRNNMRTSILAMGILFTILNFLTDLYSALSILVLLLPISLAIQYMINREFKPFNLVVVGALIVLISMFFIFYLENKLSGLDISAQLDKNFEMAMAMQKEVFNDMDMSKLEINRATRILRETYNYILTVVPMILFIVSLIVSYLNYKLSAYLLNKTREIDIEVPDFSRLALPGNFILGTVVMYLSYYIISSLGLAYAESLKYNLSFIIGFLFLIQGFSLVDYFLKKLRVGKFFRFIIIIINTVMLPIGGIVMVLGFADSIFDFRKIRKKA